MILLGLLSGGCIAGIRAGEVGHNNQDQKGLRYFLPAPYFVIEETKDGRWNAQIQNVADRKHEYYVQPYVYLGSGKATVLFHDDGTLKSFKLVADTTTIPSEVITAAKEITLEREKLKREEIEAKKAKTSAAFEGQQIEKKDQESHSVFVYRIVGDKLDPPDSGKSEVARVVFEKPAPAPMAPIPKALSSELDIGRGGTDPKQEIVVGIKGIQLTKESGGASLRFFVDEQGRHEVSDERKKAIIGSTTEGAGRLGFRLQELWDIRAIGRRVVFEKPAPAPMAPIPKALSSELDIGRGGTEQEIVVGIKGIQLTKESGGASLRFFVDEQGRHEVSDERKKAIMDSPSTKVEAGRLVFNVEQLWDIRAIRKGN